MSATGATVGVLALQGAFDEHLQLLHQAATALTERGVSNTKWIFIEVRTPEELAKCDALILPGGESTAISLVAARSGLLEPLRHFVKVLRKPTWGTCAGLILLAEAANRTKKDGQDLIGGLDVRVIRNHFGRQTESFQQSLPLSFLGSTPEKASGTPFPCVFIRAPVVESILPHKKGIQTEEASKEDMVVAPSKAPVDELAKEELKAQVEVLAKIASRGRGRDNFNNTVIPREEDIIAVKQGNVFGTSFHPELTEDPRIHVWWLTDVLKAVERRKRYKSC
ncbi:SNO glutamine amidotransferase [Delitschia confertaspora ATCC 74209]|uniref:glutaminase n=1 Tax=Delitschia confertaspora ATCC 74209 TaxID=1513339 RepID=A0A9P4JUC2_9PLEO|nr:SNO glutamine amidotransferase [Delitschia confertaspora ATCC 74209]